MKDLRSKIEVMEAFEKGHEIEFISKPECKGLPTTWEECLNPFWAWEYFNYRVKSKKSKEELFFEQVKGKKIFWTDCLGKAYNIVIPTKLNTKDSFYVDTFNQKTHSFQVCYIANGFEKHRDGFWSFCKEPTYIPFDFSDAIKLIGRVIRQKETGTLRVIHSIAKSYDFISMLNNSEFVTIDEDIITATPCGKIKE